jgi:hypothetical protein
MSESPPPVEAAPTKKQFLQAQAPLASFMDADPPAAIAAARSFPGRHPHWQRLRASVLCDAGNAAKDAAAVDEAIAIFEELHAAAPEDPQITYNLANAIANRADLDGPKAPDWLLQIRRTKCRRERVVPLLEEAGHALATYILSGRPPCAQPTVFVCHKPPVRPLLSPVR